MIRTMEMIEEPKSKRDASEAVQIKKIMVATDFSPVSDRAMDYALALARRYQSQIYLTHILSLDPYAMVMPEMAMASIDRLRRNVARHFSEMQESERLERVPYEVVIEEGPFWPTMEKVIHKEKIDFIVAGTRGAGAVSKLLVGSAAEEIFRHARIPVLTVGPETESKALYEAEFRNILFATDFGLGAGREGAWAFSLAQEHRSKLTLLHVIAPEKNLLESGMERKKQAAVQEMRELVPPATNHLCFPRFVAATGEAADEILRVAREIKADLIVMGAKPMKGFADHAPNTKAYRVMSESVCPVLTIRS